MRRLTLALYRLLATWLSEAFLPCRTQLPRPSLAQKSRKKVQGEGLLTAHFARAMAIKTKVNKNFKSIQRKHPLLFSCCFCFPFVEKLLHPPSFPAKYLGVDNESFLDRKNRFSRSRVVASQWSQWSQWSQSNEREVCVLKGVRN